MSSPQVNWDEPHKQVKWDEPQAAPMATVHKPEGGAAGWLTDLESDLRYGGSQTAVGRGLKKIGYQGPESGPQAGAGRMLVSPATGLTYAAHGVATGSPGQVLSGIGEASEIPMMFAAPETAEAASEALPAMEKVAPRIAAVGKVATQDAIAHVPGVGRLVRRPSLGDYLGAALKKAPTEARPAEEVPAEGLREVEAARPEATQQLNARIATERDLRAQPPFPRVSEGLPEVEAGQPQATDLFHREIADFRGDRNAAQGLPEVEAAQPIATQHLQNAVAPRPPAEPLPPIKPAKVGALLDKATGAKPLISNVPLKDQLDRVTPVVPKESSVISAHSYDPAAQELTVKTKNGGEYVHGDVSPEQAQAFAQADSKGKAWNDIRNNSTLVAKVVNGKRVAVQPPKGARVATPDDLTPVLEDSVRQAKANKK